MALKIVYQICCGIDVHKTFVVTCIASTNKQGVTTYKRHRFSTFTQGLKELLQWLLDNHCKDVCAELYRKSDVLPVNREITVEQAVLMAQFQGYKIKSATE